MKITSVDFIKSVDRIEQIPKPLLPEIAFAGRSNVGKSRLINTLVNRRNIAKISKKPGKTRLLNYYLVNKKFYFVDLPGYGFAFASKTEQDKWAQLLDEYFAKSTYLKGVVVITDARQGVTEKDIQMVEFLYFNKIPSIIIANKSDKLSENQLNKNISNSHKLLAKMNVTEISPFSSITGRGKDQLWHALAKLIEQRED